MHRHSLLKHKNMIEPQTLFTHFFEHICTFYTIIIIINENFDLKSITKATKPLYHTVIVVCIKPEFFIFYYVAATPQMQTDLQQVCFFYFMMYHFSALCVSTSRTSANTNVAI